MPIQIALKPDARQYTAFFNDYGIRFKLYHYIIHLNRMIGSLEFVSQTTDAVTFLIKGTHPDTCFDEVYTHMYEQQGNTLFVTVLGKENGSSMCGAAISEFEYLLTIPTQELAVGTYRVKLGDLETTFKIK